MSGRGVPPTGTGGGDERGQATPSVVAVVSVVAIVVALVAFFASAGGDGAASDAASQEQRGAAPSPSASASPRDRATAVRTPDGERTDRARDERRRDRGDEKRAKRRKRRERPEPDTGPPDVYVEVYNNSSVSGLAASTSAELQDAGWQVVGVDNWYGEIPQSTVYHPSGLEAEAKELADVLGIERVRGAVAPMKFDRLTVILTPDAA